MADALTVSQLTDYIAIKLKSDALLSSVIVRGEVTNFGVSGPHGYFVLKDAASVINCVYWNISREIAQQIKNGDELVIYGRIDVYKKGGRYNLVVAKFESVGLGTLAAQFERLKKKLGEAGYFSTEHKKMLPKLPKTVGIVTSPTGAALQDILRVAGARFCGVRLIVYPAKVQGIGAAKTVVSGIQYFNRHPVDVIIVARGGGSYEELFEFNSEELVYAIFESKIPIVSGVGHEVDISLCDLAADFRAATPSNAAEVVIPKKETLLDGVHLLRQRMDASISDALLRKKHELLKASSELKNLSKEVQLAKMRQEFRSLSDKMMELLKYKIISCRNEAGLLKERLLATDVITILNRGYAIAKKNGAYITSAHGLNVNDEITLRFKDGEIGAMVTQINKEG